MTDTASAVTSPLSGPVGQRVLAHRAEVMEVLSRFGVSNPRVFGSVARGDESSTSDLDLLVDFSAGTGLFEIFRLQDELTQVLGVEVDVVGASDLKSAARARVDPELVVL